MKYIGLALLLISHGAFACWKMQGTLTSGQEVLKINQLVSHDKTYSLGVGDIIINFKIPSSKNETVFDYEVLEKKSLRLEKLINHRLQVALDRPEIISVQNPDDTILRFTLKKI